MIVIGFEFNCYKNKQTYYIHNLLLHNRCITYFLLALCSNVYCDFIQHVIIYRWNIITFGFKKHNLRVYWKYIYILCQRLLLTFCNRTLSCIVAILLKNKITNLILRAKLEFAFPKSYYSHFFTFFDVVFGYERQNEAMCVWYRVLSRHIKLNSVGPTVKFSLFFHWWDNKFVDASA